MYTVEEGIKEAHAIIENNGINVNVTVVPSNAVRTRCYIYSNNRTVESIVRVGWLIRLGEFLNVYSLVFVLLHEYGHGFIYSRWNRMSPRDKKLWTNTFGDFNELATTGTVLGLLLRTGLQYDQVEYNTWYSTTSSHEDWAECFAIVLSGKDAPKGDKAAHKLRTARKLIKKYAA